MEFLYNYCSVILHAFNNLKTAKLSTSSLLFKEGESDSDENGSRNPAYFMGHFEHEFEKLPIITPPAILEIELAMSSIPHGIDWKNLKLQIGNSWPLVPKLHEYIKKLLK